jgi:hypothetical protein
MARAADQGNRAQGSHANATGGQVMLWLPILFLAIWVILLPIAALLIWLSSFLPRSYFEFTDPKDIRPGYYYTGGSVSRPHRESGS